MYMPVLQSEDFSKSSICDTALEHQNTTVKRFIDAVKITPELLKELPQSLDKITEIIT